MQEVGELAGSLVGDHEGPPEWELRQIVAICINWLDMRCGELAKQRAAREKDVVAEALSDAI